MKNVFFTFSLITCSQSSFAFTLNNNVEAKFQGDFVSVNFSASSSCTNTGRSVEQIRSLIDLALKKFWNAVPTSGLDIRPGSLLDKGDDFETEPLCTNGVNSPCTPNPALNVDDGIFIFCNNNAFNFTSSSIAGATLTNNIEQDKLKGAVIALNDRSNSLLASVSDDTLVAVLAHEIGHAFGLGHSPHNENLMYYATVPKREELGWDDIEAVTYLYPRADKILGLVGCDFIDINAQSPSNSDEALKVYHQWLKRNSNTNTEVIGHSLADDENFFVSSTNFILSLLLGLSIFPLGLLWQKRTRLK